MHTGRAVQYAVVVVVAEYSRCIGEPVRYLYSLFKQWPSRRSVVLVNLRQVVIQSSDIDTACSSRRARVPPLVWLSSKRVHQRLAWLLWLVAPHKTITSIRRLISRFGSSLRRHFVKKAYCLISYYAHPAKSLVGLGVHCAKTHTFVNPQSALGWS